RFVFGFGKVRERLVREFAELRCRHGETVLRRRGCSAVGMYSKSPLTATAVAGLVATLLLAGCSGLLPWHNEPVGEEINLVFTLDYRTGVLTYQPEGIHPELMSLYSFANEPMVNVLIDGRSVAAVVDTASPDTLVLPRGNDKAARRTARVQIGTTDFGNVDVR